MTLSALGIFSAAGAGVVDLGAYDLLETNILGSAQSSITFSSLATYASTYKHLQIRALVNGPGSISMRFNGVTSSGSYKDHRLFGLNGSVGSDTIFTNQLYLGSTPVVGSTNQFGPKVIDILDAFSTTKNKTTRTLSGRANTSATEAIIELLSGLFISTDSTTSIELFGSSNMSVGSRFSLYGIKG
jgi:hypothetical protein